MTIFGNGEGLDVEKSHCYPWLFRRCRHSHNQQHDSHLTQISNGYGNCNIFDRVLESQKCSESCIHLNADHRGSKAYAHETFQANPRIDGDAYADYEVCTAYTCGKVSMPKSYEFDHDWPKLTICSKGTHNGGMFGDTLSQKGVHVRSARSSFTINACQLYVTADPPLAGQWSEELSADDSMLQSLRHKSSTKKLYPDSFNFDCEGTKTLIEQQVDMLVRIILGMVSTEACGRRDLLTACPPTICKRKNGAGAHDTVASHVNSPAALDNHISNKCPIQDADLDHKMYPYIVDDNIFCTKSPGDDSMIQWSVGSRIVGFGISMSIDTVRIHPYTSTAQMISVMPDEQQSYPEARSGTLVDEEVDDGKRQPLVKSLDDKELMSAEPASSSSRSRKCSSLLTLIAEERQQREELRANVTASESAEGVDVVETAEFTEKIRNGIPAITTMSMIGILIERFEAEEVIIQDRDACKQAICQVGLRTRNMLEECSSSSWTTCKVSAYHLVLVTIHDAGDAKKKDAGRGLRNHELETTREADDICIIDFCFGNGSPNNIIDVMRVRASRCQPLTGDLIIAETLVHHHRVIHRSNRESVEKVKRKELRADVTIRKWILLKRSEDIICKDGTICEQKITSEDNGFKIIEIPFHVIHSDGKGEWNHEA